MGLWWGLFEASVPVYSVWRNSLALRRIPPVLLVVLGILSSVSGVSASADLLCMVAVVSAERGVGCQPKVHLSYHLLAELAECLMELHSQLLIHGIDGMQSFF